MATPAISDGMLFFRTRHYLDHAIGEGGRSEGMPLSSQTSAAAEPPTGALKKPGAAPVGRLGRHACMAGIDPHDFETRTPFDDLILTGTISRLNPEPVEERYLRRKTTPVPSTTFYVRTSPDCLIGLHTDASKDVAGAQQIEFLKPTKPGARRFGYGDRDGGRLGLLDYQ